MPWGGAQLQSGLSGSEPHQPAPSQKPPALLTAKGAVPRAFWALTWLPGPLPFRSCPPNYPRLLLPQSYTPTVFERLAVNLQVKGKPIHLQIWDTAGGCRAGGGAGWEEGPHPLPSEPGRPSSLQGTGVSLNPPHCSSPDPGQPTGSWRGGGTPGSLEADCFWPPECSTLALAPIRLFDLDF